MDSQTAIVLAALIGAAGGIGGSIFTAIHQPRVERAGRKDLRQEARRGTWLEAATEAYVAANAAVAHLGDPGLAIASGSQQVDVSAMIDAQQHAKDAHRLLWRAAAMSPTTEMAELLREAGVRITEMAAGQAQIHNLQMTIREGQGQGQGQAAPDAEVEEAFKAFFGRWQTAIIGKPGAEGIEGWTTDHILDQLQAEIAAFAWSED